LAGRGLGLSIAREKIEKLNGTLSVESKEYIGTTFKILIPTTLATFRGVLVEVGESSFIIPGMNVEIVTRIKAGDISSVENHETMQSGGTILSLASLGEVLGILQHQNGVALKKNGDHEKSDYIKIIILVSGEHRMAFIIDEISDEQQVLVKGLGKLLKRVKMISGSTILPSGKIVPVLHVNDLIKAAIAQKGRRKGMKSEDVPLAAIAGRILVAEDSITSRTLLKNILETAGYLVKTAVDGSDAYTIAQNEAFDLIVSDVDMPKMNGFELTTKIKKDKTRG